jgi:hypothetical protein
VSRRTSRPQPAISQEELDKLDDAQLDALRKSSMALAGQSMAAASFYQRTADRCQKAQARRKEKSL